MTPEARIDEIFNDALDLPPGRRRGFLTRACGPDDQLRQRVEVLLLAFESSESFLASPHRASLQSDELASTVPAMISLRSGQILGDRYRVEERLGIGGMGEVWRAFDRKLRVDVALKFLHSRLLTSNRARELLRHEVRSARNVISPNVCRIFDLVIEGSQELVSMEYVDGHTLLEHVEKNAPMSVRDAGELASQLLAGLEAIHAADLVHRDLKPENVMVTRSGRVVIMDFGIARALHEAKATVAAGTPAYMAPEQARGEPVDARADIFAVGVILAELLGFSGAGDSEARRAIWSGVRQNPPLLPDNAWQGVLMRAVAWEPKKRFPSAKALSRALEEVSLRAVGDDDRNPYPGLSSFRSENAEFFFGREAEVESIWKRLQTLHLLAIIGPSGVGKSSFIQAGIVPTAPADWRCVTCSPGSSPFTSVAQAMVPELAGNTEAMQHLLNLRQPASAVRVFSQWRQSHGQVLLIVDQFEELFTLNPEEVQGEFAQFLGDLALDSDVHVLLSMRDDFLFRCHAFPPLTPILSDLTLISPLSGAALRRALVQPALACGYRFEDESLVDEMIKSLQAERGALPLLAFAAARMWERRDRPVGVLSREAYEGIGGVAGALARHAEDTLERIGIERAGTVREIFRNLVTSQGTRAVQYTEELLSVFDDSEQAEEVLRALIDARLITTFEAPGSEDSEEPGSSRVEIIHESLLSAWPRLVRWQTQDADSARLRDQLRQAAQLWTERGRLEDMLWTGTAYREFDLWRERYPGGLTSTEEAFAEAMSAKVAQQRRRRRVMLVGAFTALIAVGAVIGVLYLNAAERARQLAARTLWTRAENSLEDENNQLALAFAIGSLEREDKQAVRRIAIEALWHSPIAFEAPSHGHRPYSAARFTPDGEWLATCDQDSGVLLWPSNGAPPRVLNGLGNAWRMDMSEDGSRLVAAEYQGSNRVGMWAIPSGELLRTWEFDVMITNVHLRDGRLITAGLEPGENWRTRMHAEWRSYPLVGNDPPVVLGRANTTTGPQRQYELTRDGRWVLDSNEQESYLFPIEDLENADPVRVWSHDAQVRGVGSSPDGTLIASSDLSGELRVTTLGFNPKLRHWGQSSQGHYFTIEFDRSSRYVAGARGRLDLFDLNEAPGAAPLVLVASDNYLGRVDFHLDGQWLALVNWMGTNNVYYFPLTNQYPVTFEAPLGKSWDASFSPDGRFVALAGEAPGEMRVCKILPEFGEPSYEVLYRTQDQRTLFSVAFDAQGTRVAVGSFTEDGVHVVSLDGSPTIELEGLRPPVSDTAFSPSGRLVLAAGTRVSEAGGDAGWGTDLRIWNLETGDSHEIETEHGESIWNLEFLSEDEFLAVSGAGLELWAVDGSRHRILDDTPGTQGQMAIDTSPDRRYIAYAGAGDPVIVDLQTNETRTVPMFGWTMMGVAVHPEAEFLAGATIGGHVLVHYLDQEEPHLLMRHGGGVNPGGVRLDLATERIVVVGPEGIGFWPIPKGEPLYSRPLDEFLDILRAQTNLGAVEIPDRPGHYTIEAVRPWNGWKQAPKWQQW